MVETREFFSVRQYIKDHVLVLAFFGGLLLILIGSILGVFTSHPYLDTLGEFLLKTGGGILGAGVFGTLVKATQFIDIFQKHISEVVYSPDKHNSNLELQIKWRRLTEAMLSDVLPHAYSEAADQLEETLFKEKQDYHYEKIKINYDITADQNSGEASIKTEMEVVVKLSPTAETAIFTQSTRHEDEGEFSPQSPLINNQLPMHGEVFVASPDDGNEHILEIDLAKYSPICEGEERKEVTVRRIGNIDQNLFYDPVIIFRLGRFCRELSVEVGCPSWLKLRLTQFGERDLPKENKIELDDRQIWTIGEKSKLLLPGLGFTISALRHTIRCVEADPADDTSKN